MGAIRRNRQSRASEKRGYRLYPLFPVARGAADLPCVFQPDLGCLLILALDGLVHFATMNRNLARRVDPEPNLVAAHVDDGYDDIVAYDDAFVALSGKDKHDTSMIG